MIRSKFYDVEILKNFFSITIIDITSYLETMKDICDEKGNPIPLVQKLTVAEIKERLDSVKFESYYITDTDDSQLFERYIDKDIKAVLGDYSNLKITTQEDLK